MTGEPTVEEQALALADEVLTLRARLRERDDELDRLRAENAALAAALDDIAGMRLAPSGLWLADAECASENKRCHHRYPDDPGEWCPVCVAEVAWCAWKMGVLGG